MRKTLIAIALGLTALAAAACGGSSTGTTAPLESVAPMESTDTSSPALESPSDMVLPSDSPASS